MCNSPGTCGSLGRLSPPLDAKGAIQTSEGIKKEHFDLWGAGQIRDDKSKHKYKDHIGKYMN